MKRKFFLLTIAIVAVVATIGISKNANEVELSDLALANVEALAYGESGGGSTVDCYSSSRSSSGATYYDCGTCEKQYNSKGEGNMRTCTK